MATNWSEAGGYPVTLTGSISSTNGATVSYDANYVYYSNPNNVADQINYTVSDSYGDTAGGVINVVVISGASQLFQSAATDSNYHPLLSGHGSRATPTGWRARAVRLGHGRTRGRRWWGANGSWTFTDASVTMPATVFHRLYWPYDANNPPQ